MLDSYRVEVIIFEPCSRAATCTCLPTHVDGNQPRKSPEGSENPSMRIDLPSFSKRATRVPLSELPEMEGHMPDRKTGAVFSSTIALENQ